MPIEGRYSRNELNQYPRVDVSGGTVPIRQGYTYDADGNMSEQWAVGDADCDGLVTNFDVDAFILAVSDPGDYATTYPGCDISHCDVNGDTYVNNFDVDPFIALLGGQGAIARSFKWDAENRLIEVVPTQATLPTDGQAYLSGPASPGAEAQARRHRAARPRRPTGGSASVWGIGL